MKRLIVFKSLILATLFLSPTLMSCSEDDSETDPKYAVAETKLREDYKEYVIGAISWDTERDYQIGTFDITTKALNQSITAWYEVRGETATRKMDSKDLGVTLPDVIKNAFQATKYSDATLWRIEEVELEQNYSNNGIEIYYEVELDNIQNPNLEAELFFSETGELLYSKEEQDDDDDDKDDDRFVVNAELKAAVEAAAPGTQIIEAEIDGQFIEVEAIIIVDGVITKEIELEFTMDYKLVSSETETKYTYSTLPEKFDLVKTWFSANPTIAPAPAANTEVEITEGKQTETDDNIGEYYYEVEIDDYINGGKEYEVEFYLNKDLTIKAIIVNEEKQA